MHFPAKSKKSQDVPLRKHPPVNVSINNATTLALYGKNFGITFDKMNGLISNWTVNGRELISGEGLRPSFWRPQTDNDFRGAATHNLLKEWKESENDRNVSSFTMNETSDGSRQTVIEYSFFSGKVKWTNSVQVSGAGIIEVDASVDADTGLPVIPKIGLSVWVPSINNYIKWFGRGPHENYIDRAFAAEMGLYEMGIDQFITPYIKPQENGNKTDVRWLKLTGKDGNGIEVKGNGHLSMSVWPCINLSPYLF